MLKRMRRKLTIPTIFAALALFASSCDQADHSGNHPPAGLAAVSPKDDIGTKMRRFAEQAVLDAAQHYETRLDYTPESVESIEKILVRLSQSPEFGRYTEKDKRAAALIHGAYIGEVIRRQYGGEWAENHAEAGEGSYPISWQGQDSFPYTWCYKRLTGDISENVWHKYQYFVSKTVDPKVKIEVIQHDVSK